MALAKNLKFFNSLFLFRLDQGTMFWDVIDRKKAFLDYKILNLHSLQIGIFQRGYNP